MVFTVRTELGRKVLLNDLVGFHRDQVLSVLYYMRDDHGAGVGLTIQQIADLTGLGVVEACDLIAVLKRKPRLIEHVTPSIDTWAIAPRGVRWVEESPDRPR